MDTIIVDYHVHCGQYYDLYFSPKNIMKVLYENGIKEIWISSTTSCVQWNNIKEKKEIINFIDNEIKECVFFANKYDIKITPLYWVIPQRFLDGESIESIMDNSLYKGFKIHPQIGGWDRCKQFSNNLFEDVCLCATKKSLPVLIHTGEDDNVQPNRFEKYFAKYPNVKFVLAHCKEPYKIINMFSKYKNVYGDIAFCPKNSFFKICNAGFENRMQIGTDFPITYWFEINNKVDQVSLKWNYIKTLNKIKNY